MEAKAEGMAHGSEPRFCPTCRGGLTPRRLKPEEPERLVCLECGSVLFLDPKVAACTICPLDGGVVLVRRGIEPAHGKWVIPGGHVDRGEAVQDAAVRETLEARVFPLSDLPWGEMAFPSTVEALREYVRRFGS